MIVETAIVCATVVVVVRWMCLIVRSNLIDKDGQTVWLHESPGVCTCGAYRLDEHDADCPVFSK